MDIFCREKSEKEAKNVKFKKKLKVETALIDSRTLNKLHLLEVILVKKK